MVAAAAAVVLSTGAAVVQAGAFSVSPLRAELTEQTKAASFTVANAASTPSSFQVNVRKWTQDAQGNDVYEDTKDLVVFPKQLDVPANGKRIVRVGIEGKPSGTELAYRVFIEELPPAAAASEGRKGTISVVGRFALPVFVRSKGVKGQLVIDSAGAKDGTYKVRVSNGGTARIRLVQLDIGPGSPAEITNPYILPGAAREYSGTLGKPCVSGAKVKVKAASEIGLKAEKELVLPPDACPG
jgi:fimbrial chaperone protein